MLIVTWDRTSAAALHVDASTDSSIRGTWSAPWPEGVSPQDPAAAGAWLRGEWGRAGFPSSIPVWVVLPREDVVLRHLELPQAPDEELPDLVRFQTAGRSTVPLEQLAIDYIPLAQVSGRPGRDVLAVTIAKPTLQTVRQLITATERELVGVSFTSLALGEWGEQLDRRRQRGRSGSASDSTLVLAWDGSRIELSVVCGNELTFAHAARIPVGDGVDSTTAVLSEVSRTLVAGQRLRPGLQVDHAWLLGGNEALSSALADRLECSVDRVEPHSASETRIDWKGLADRPATTAILLGVRSPSITAGINFLKPRQAPPKRDPRKRVLAVGAAAALLLAFLIGAMSQFRLQSLDREIEDLYAKSIELEDQVEAGAPLLSSASILKDWTLRNTNQLSQLVDIEAVMPGGLERPYLYEYEFGVTTGDNLAKISAMGAAKSRSDIETLWQDLRQEYGYQVIPKEVTVSRDPAYPHRYVLDLTVPRQKATQGLAEQPSTPPAT